MIHQNCLLDAIHINLRLRLLQNFLMMTASMNLTIGSDTHFPIALTPQISRQTQTPAANSKQFYNKMANRSDCSFQFGFGHRETFR